MDIKAEIIMYRPVRLQMPFLTDWFNGSTLIWKISMNFMTL